MIGPRQSPRMSYKPCNLHSKRFQKQNDGTRILVDLVVNEAQHLYCEPHDKHFRFCCLHALINGHYRSLVLQTNGFRLELRIVFLVPNLLS